MRTLGRAIAVAWIVVAGPSLACAQGATGAHGVDVDLSVPESPAFVVLGLSPQSVVRPSSAQELAASVLNGLDKNGNFQSGLALDLAPYPLLLGDAVTLAKYQEHPNGFSMTRFLWRTQLSAATAKGATDDEKSVRIGLGLRLTPWDRGDPRFDSATYRSDRKPGLIECLKRVEAEIPPLKPPEEDPASAAKIKEAEQKLKAGSQACREDAQKYLWNNSSFSLGAAPSWISTDGTTDNIRWNGGGAWASMAYGFEGVSGLEDRAQLIFHARYRGNEQVPDPKAQGRFFEQDSVLAGARLRIGTDRFAVSLEGLSIHEDPVDRRSSSSGRFTVGLDIRLTKELWLEIAVGGEGGRRDGNNQAFALTSFKWGTSSEPKISIPR